MAEFNLKDKIQITKEFVDELSNKSWQEIEHIQNQLANIAGSTEGKKVELLLKNLLTSYYIFVGGLENLNDVNEHTVIIPEEPAPKVIEPDEPKIADIVDFDIPMTDNDVAVEDSEPFEYFVDFDDPIGEPLTDKDLYN